MEPPPDSQPACLKAAVGLLAAFLFVLPFSSSAALRNAFLGLAVLALACAAAKGALARPRLPPWRVLVPLLAWSAWCLASVAWSVDPAYSRGELRPGLLYPLIAFLAFFAATASLETMDRWAWSLSAGLAGLGIAAVGEVVLHGWWDPQRWHGDVGFYATHVVLAMPLLAWAFLRAAPGALLARTALAASALLTLVATSWNDNRIAWIALAAMTVLAAILLRERLAGPRRAWILGGTAAAVLAFAALFLLAVEQRAERLQGTEFAEEAQLAHDPRPALWDYAARRHGEAPWAGFGYGREILRLGFRTGVTPGVDNRMHTHAHNTPVNVLLQGGIVGLALFAWMVAALVREMAKGLRAGDGRRLAAVLGLTLVAGFAIRNMTDDFLVRHNALLAWSLAGAVLGALRGGGATSARTPA